MTYNEFINKELQKTLKGMFAYGQNVNAGSCLGGLARGCGGVNTQNSEASLVGMGMGLMLAGDHAVYLMKQYDFLFLATDQLVNTMKLMRLIKPKGAFSIFTTIIDDASEGPQTSKNLPEFCRLLDIEYISLTSAKHIPAQIKLMKKPGFRIFGVNKTLLQKKVR